MKKSKPKIKLYIPSWISSVYTVLAVLLIPWTVYLSYSLPTKYVQRHWDITWVGLDIAIILLLLITGFLAFIKSRWVIISLVMTASFLLVDAWFDVISARQGKQLFQAILLAVIIEVPLAIIGLVLAYKTINKNVD